MAGEEKQELPFITKALIIAILAIVVVVASAGVAFFVATKATKNLNIAQTESGGSKKEKEGKEEIDLEIGPIIDYGEYTLNLKDVDPRYLVCQIQLEVDASGKDKGKKGMLELSGESQKVIIQDKILTVLKSKTTKDLDQDVSLINLRKEIIKEINENVLRDGKIKNVYFVSWVIQ